MKRISFAKEAYLRLNKGEKTYYRQDFSDIPKSLIPGEWLFFESKDDLFLGFINLNVEESRPIAYIVIPCKRLPQELLISEKEEDVLLYLLQESIKRRESLLDYELCCRLVYGLSDHLPGLIIDKYKNALIIQINTAGIDRFRESIKRFLQKKYPELEVILLDHEKYRQGEMLPSFNETINLKKIDLEENAFHIKVTAQNMQKIGYYYDHRVNRQKFETLLRGQKGKLEHGLDLFCYMGSWGMHMLRAGTQKITFVDQSNVAQDVINNAIYNGFEERGEFVHSDVYKFLDQQIQLKANFDVICSDPPAFTKSAKNKHNALGGYQRLHEKILQLIRADGIVAICSCTHYISLEELDATVQLAARKVGKDVFLIDMGMQAQDHPVRSLTDKANYLKYLAYRVE